MAHTKTLRDILLAPHQKDAVIHDFSVLLRQQLTALSGLKGLALKTTVNMLESSRPGALDRALASLLPGFAKALEPLYQEFLASSDRDFSLFLRKHEHATVQALLSVSDERIKDASDTGKSIYRKFRGTAEDQVRNAIPKLSRLIASYLDG